MLSYFNYGFRVVVHDQREEPLIEDNGIDIMPGHMTTISFQKMQVSDDCNTSQPYFNEKENHFFEAARLRYWHADHAR